MDGNIVIGGVFTIGGPRSRFNYIARLTPNGLVDSTFNPGTGPNNVVSCLALQEDHKIVVGGSFTQVQWRYSQPANAAESGWIAGYRH